MENTQQEMGEWLAGQRLTFSKRWFDEGRQFPFFAALKPSQLRAIIKREFDGLLSFILSDQTGLDGATETHREQADDFMRGAPVKEQIGFLERRIEVITEVMNGDPSTESFKADFFEKMDHASRYYKTILRSIDVEQRFSSIT